MPKKYAGLIKVVLLTAFYAPAMPFVLIFTIIGLTLWFWADKYMLLKHMSLPKSIDDDLTEAMVEYLEWAACTFAVGSIMFSYTLKDATGELAFIDTARSLIWLALAVSLFHIFFPMSMLNKKLFKVKSQACENQTFEEARLSFTSDYDIENPITRKLAFRRHLMRKRDSSPANKKYNNNFQSKDDDFDFDALENYARRDQENEYKGSGGGQDPGLKGVYKKLDQLINAEEVDLNNLFENIFGLDLDDILNDTPRHSQTPVQITGAKKSSVKESTHADDNIGPYFLAGLFGGIAGGIVGGLGLIKLQGKGNVEQAPSKKDHGVKWKEILGNLHITMGLNKKNPEEPAQEQAKGESDQTTPLDKSVETNATRRVKSGPQDSISSAAGLLNKEKEEDKNGESESIASPQNANQGLLNNSMKKGDYEKKSESK